MARDIIVTTPKSEIGNAAAEAEACKRDGGGYYFRQFHALPRGVGVGSRVFYVEDGYVRGFAAVSAVREKGGTIRCDTTGRTWGGEGRAFLVMRADSWNWIRPIPMRGFQGWRYFDAPAPLHIVGGWRDPRPATN